MSTDIALHQVVEFIMSADALTIDRVTEAVKERHRSLRAAETAIARASLNVGDPVTLVGLSPKYLNGLSGVIAAPRGGKFDVKISDAWIDPRAAKYITNQGDARILRGVPAPCLVAV